MIKKIVSGGQTGVDRAALDAAIEIGIPYGGWIPQGRLDEEGVIPTQYSELQEISGNYRSEKENYDARTKRNIADSDGTLIFVPKIPIPSNINDGTLLTLQEVQKQKKPYHIVDLSRSQHDPAEFIQHWARSYEIKTLNVAGPRESSCIGIYELSFELLKKVFRKIAIYGQDF